MENIKKIVDKRIVEAVTELTKKYDITPTLQEKVYELKNVQ